jgi:hypothetical protein
MRLKAALVLRMASWVWLCASLIGLSVLVSSGSDESRKGSFSLRLVNLPTGLYVYTCLDSYSCGTIAALCSPEAVYVQGETAVNVFSTEGDVLEPLFSANMGLKPFPLQVLEDYSVLSRTTDRQKQASWRASVDRREPGLRHDPRPFIRFEMVGLATGEVLDITPSNLDGTLEWHGYTGPPFLWSEERGFTFFIPEIESREIHLWQGSGTLAEAQRTPPVLALGRGFVDGLLTYAVVTDEGGMLVYGRDQGLMAKSQAFSDLGKEIATALGAPQAWPKWPVRFVFAEGIAAFKSYESGPYGGCELISADGSRQVIAIVDAFTVKPDGSERDVTEADALVEDASPLRLEGKTQPPDVVASPVLVPVDGRRIGIVDGLYQRLIVISLPE